MKRIEAKLRNASGESDHHSAEDLEELREQYFPNWQDHVPLEEYREDLRPLYQVRVFSEEERVLVEELAPEFIALSIRQYRSKREFLAGCDPVLVVPQKQS